MRLVILVLAITTLAAHSTEGSGPRTLEVRALNDGWVLSEGQAAVVNITPEEARRRALQEAWQNAIEFAVGIDVLGQKYLRREEGEEGAFHSISEQTSAGRIVEERSREFTAYTVPGSPLPVTVYRARVEVKVEEEKGPPDPDFKVQVELNQERFQAGDEMVIAITATKLCYVTVLCVTASDTVIVLLPHEYRTERTVTPGDTLWLPDRDDRAKGIHFQVEPPIRQESAVEWIKVIATRKPHVFGQSLERVSLYSQMPTRQAAYVELMGWMVGIPRYERAEAQVTYEVSGKN